MPHPTRKRHEMDQFMQITDIRSCQEFLNLRHPTIGCWRTHVQEKITIKMSRACCDAIESIHACRSHSQGRVRKFQHKETGTNVYLSTHAPRWVALLAWIPGAGSIEGVSHVHQARKILAIVHCERVDISH